MNGLLELRRDLPLVLKDGLPDDEGKNLLDAVSGLLKRLGGPNAAYLASDILAMEASAGMRSFCTDATSTTFRDALAGGGANAVPVHHDGTIWRVG